MTEEGNKQSYSIAIPAYGRPNELIELFDSIYQMEKQPGLPKTLYSCNMVFGKNAYYLYSSIRKAMQ